MISADDGKSKDYFGYSVAIDGNTLLVGSHKTDINNINDAGAAYVYVLTDGTWRQQAKLFATPHYQEDSLGGNVALNNDIAMLGVMRRDDKGEDSGAVISFKRESNTWRQQQIFTAPDAKAGDAFGQTVALSEKYLVIGAPRSDAIGQDSGAVYIYQYVNDTWTYQTKLTASDGLAGDLFGISVAIDGNTILVGADLHDLSAEDAGAVYVYVLEDNQWQEQSKLLASDGEDSDIFGVRVSLSGDTALISARRDDIDGVGIDAGSAYVFVRQDNSWRQQVKLTSPDGKADDRFGRGVSIVGDTAVISAMKHDANGPDTGALYVYKREANGWRYHTKIIADGGMDGDHFGWNVAMADNLIAVATPNHDAKGPESGAVYVHDLSVSSQ